MMGIRMMRDAALSGADQATLAKTFSAAKETREEATRAARRAAKALAKAEQAARTAEALAVKPVEATRCLEKTSDSEEGKSQKEPEGRRNRQA
jgi:hypothetical protein